MFVAGQAEHLTKPQLLGIEPRAGDHALNAIVVDANRDRHDRRAASFEPHARAVCFDLGAQLVLHGEDEIASIALDLKREQIVGEQSGEQLAPPLAHQQTIGIRPRDVPEQRRPNARTPPAQIQRRHREVIVLEKYRRVGRRHFACRSPRQSARSHACTRSSRRSGTSAVHRRDGRAATSPRSQILRSRRRTHRRESTTAEGRRTDCRAARVPCRPHRPSRDRPCPRRARSMCRRARASARRAPLPRRRSPWRTRRGRYRRNYEGTARGSTRRAAAAARSHRFRPRAPGRCGTAPARRARRSR